MNNGLLENIFNDNIEQLKELDYSVATLKGQYRQCPHCGVVTGAKGIGTHMQSGRCLAGRQYIYAQLNGYVRAPVEWNKYTAVFQKRFWTDWEKGIRYKTGSKHGGRLKQQAWVEGWFAALWKKCAHTYKPGNNPCYEIDMLGEPIKPYAGPTQVPKPEYLEHFEALAKYKRNRSTKKLDAVRGILELALEGVGDPE